MHFFLVFFQCCCIPLPVLISQWLSQISCINQILFIFLIEKHPTNAFQRYTIILKHVISTLTAMFTWLVFSVAAMAQINGESEAFTFDTLSIPISLSGLALVIIVILIGFFLVRRYHLMRKKIGSDC